MNPNRANTPTSPYLQPKILGLGGTYIAYLESGSGDPTVFIPGLEEGSFIFAHQIRHPSKLGHLYAFDNVGSGASDRPAIEYCPRDYIKYAARFLDKAVSRPAQLCAHGDSSGLAIALALVQSAKVSSVVLVNPDLATVTATKPAPHKATSFASHTPIGEFLLGIRVSAQARIRLWRISRSASGNDEVLRYSALKRLLHIPGAKTVGVRRLMHVSEWNEWISRVNEVTQPLRVVIGGRLRSRHAEALRYLQQRAQKVEVFVIEGAGRYPMIETPEKFAEVISHTGGRPSTA